MSADTDQDLLSRRVACEWCRGGGGDDTARQRRHDAEAFRLSGFREDDQDPGGQQPSASQVCKWSRPIVHRLTAS